MHGVFVVPARRIDRLQFWPPPAVSVLAAVPLVAALGLLGRRVPRAVLLSALALGVVVVSGVLQPWADPALRTPLHVASRLARDAEHGLIPLLVIVGVVALARRKIADPRAVALIIAVMATGTLVQFPYAFDQYFLFVAPLVVLTALALSPTRAAAIVAAGCLCFAAIKAQLERYPVVPLGIWRPPVSADINAKYQALVAAVSTHARGEYIVRGPRQPAGVFPHGVSKSHAHAVRDVRRHDGTNRWCARGDRRARGHDGRRERGAGERVGANGPGVARGARRAVPVGDTVGQYVVRWR